MAAPSDTPIVRFYRGTGTDQCGRGLDEILRWDDDRLEDLHDFIQWLFPLDEPSGVNPHAPLVTAADRRAFRDDPALAVNLRRAFERMLAFYGFRLMEVDGKFSVERSDDWIRRARAWLQPHNHNYLRLTRIMKSVNLLGLPELAQALHVALMKEASGVDGKAIGATTRRFWEDAGRA